MKIVHVSASRYGGAGRSAYRLHEAMLAEGLESSFISGDEVNTSEMGNNWYTLARPVVKKAWWQKWFGEPEKVSPLNAQLNALAPQLQCEAASLPESDTDLLNDPRIQNADIINLHWVSGLMDYASFFRNMRQPVVWTIHDMQPFSGLFHYEEDLERNPKAFTLNEEITRVKQSAISKRTCPLQVVAPSRWLLNKALQSEVFQGLAGIVIPYSLDLDTFELQDKKAARNSLRLQEDQHYLLFVSKHITVHRKGWQFLNEAMNQLADTFPNWTMIVIGRDNHLPASKYNRVLAGNITEDRVLALWYAACDMVAIPSLEDNLPNVMLEALACGRPVLSFDNGGMREHIIPQKTGWIGEPADLLTMLVDSFNTFSQLDEKLIRQYAVDHFNRQQQVSSYLALYEETLRLNGTC